MLYVLRPIGKRVFVEMPAAQVGSPTLAWKDLWETSLYGKLALEMKMGPRSRILCTYGEACSADPK